MAKGTTRRMSVGSSKHVKPPNAWYQSVLELLFSEPAAEHAYKIFAGQNPLAGAYTTDQTTNLWHA